MVLWYWYKTYTKSEMGKGNNLALRFPSRQHHHQLWWFLNYFSSENQNFVLLGSSFIQLDSLSEILSFTRFASGPTVFQEWQLNITIYIFYGRAWKLSGHNLYDLKGRKIHALILQEIAKFCWKSLKIPNKPQTRYWLQCTLRSGIP